MGSCQLHIRDEGREVLPCWCSQSRLAEGWQSLASNPELTPSLLPPVWGSKPMQDRMRSDLGVALNLFRAPLLAAPPLLSLTPCTCCPRMAGGLSGETPKPQGWDREQRVGRGPQQSRADRAGGQDVPSGSRHSWSEVPGGRGIYHFR